MFNKIWISYLIFTAFIISAVMYYIFFFTPKNSLELYQSISFAADFDDVQKVMLEGYESNFTEVDYDFISNLEHSPNSIIQSTLFEYDEKTYILMTTPGTEKLKVLAVEELPEEIAQYLLEIIPE